VNNAGIQTFKSFMECKEEEFISVLRVNLFASYWILREFLPSMLSRNHGHIVSIAGSAGLLGFCHMSDNCTSKFAMLGMMESIDHVISIFFNYLSTYTLHIKSIKLNRNFHWLVMMV